MMRGWSALLLAASPIAATGAQAQNEPNKTYLLSIADLPLGKDGALKSFFFATWGVTFHAICQIPPGWTISAGGSATPDGELKGEGSLGITWFRSSDPPELQSLALVTLSGSAQKDDIKTKDGALIPASFKGKAMIGNDKNFKKAALTTANIRLAEASQCPERTFAEPAAE